jgi:hypothetical protein
MVLINKAINEITVKLVFYGPGLCGKTTNLEKIYQNPKMSNKGKMISMSTETDRTLFFDFMPMELGTIGGQKVRVQLYTVPGQVFYDATRKLVLRGADGVVFVADSQASMRESNIDSLENLKTNLRINRLDPAKIPIAYQLNKRDLPNVASVEEMKEYLKTGTAPVVEASAISGAGVTQTLRAAVALMLENIKGNVDITLYEGPELRKPDLKAPSGVTAGSAGTPKIGVISKPPAPAATPAPAREAPPPVASPAPAPVAAPPTASPFGIAESPFGEPDTSAFAEVGDEGEDFGAAAAMDESQEATAEADPFEDAAAMAVVEDSAPFGEDVALPAVSAIPDEASPFGAPEPEPEPLAVPVEPLPMSEYDTMLSLLENARALVQQLEAALEVARRHEKEILRRLG